MLVRVSLKPCGESMFTSSPSVSMLFGVVKFGFLSVLGSSAGIKIDRLGLEFDKFYEPRECVRDIRRSDYVIDRLDSRTVSAEFTFPIEPLAGCIAAGSDFLLP